MSIQSPLRDAPIMDNSGKNIFSQFWSGWFRVIYNILNPGITTTVALAKLTGGGTNGSLTVKNGVITGYVAPT